MTQYRKYLKPQPFLDAQRNISRRLSKIEAQILQKIPIGEPRELMRRTIARLLQGEGTVQGKIRQLMAVVDRFQGIDLALTNDCTEEGSFRVRNRSKERQGSLHVMRDGSIRKGRSSFDDPHCRKLQSSSGMQRFRTENYDASDEDYPSRTSYSSLLPPPSPSLSHPFSKMPMHASEQYPLQPSPSASASQLYQSINQKDIFSFRTQKEQQSPSPLPKFSPKIEQSSKGMVRKGREKTSDKKKSSPSHSPSLSHSKSRSKRSINYSSDNSPAKSKKSSIKRSPNKSKYDGVSQSFSPSQKQSQNLSKTVSQRLYQKIMNRLKYSQCVLGKVQHSGSIPAQNILENRIKLQKEMRGILRRDIVDSVQAASIWKY